jgi:DtxR family manganese transport transcriptional regulator
MTGADDDKQGAVRQAERFGHVRHAHQRELAEDYVELIADLIAQRGEARVVDLADCLGVTNATVNNAIQRLRRDGLVTSKPYPRFSSPGKAGSWPGRHASAIAWFGNS